MPKYSVLWPMFFLFTHDHVLKELVQAAIVAAITKRFQKLQFADQARQKEQTQ